MIKEHFCPKCNNYTYIKLEDNEGHQLCYLCGQPRVDAVYRKPVKQEIRNSAKRPLGDAQSNTPNAKRLKKLFS